VWQTKLASSLVNFRAHYKIVWLYFLLLCHLNQRIIYSSRKGVYTPKTFLTLLQHRPPTRSVKSSYTPDGVHVFLSKEATAVV